MTQKHYFYAVIGWSIPVILSMATPCVAWDAPGHSMTVEMALAIRDSVDHLKTASWDKREYDLGLGIGVASGFATIGAIGLEELGLFGIFEWDALDVGDERGLSGVLAEPNPFSPNGDGLYDETTITFYLGRPADHVNIDFYDLAGVLARRLVSELPTNYTGRTFLQITWDGTDTNGHVVPYGLYVMRVEAKFKTEPTFERVNRPVAVIK